jgi:hypothetical protein
LKELMADISAPRVPTSFATFTTKGIPGLDSSRDGKSSVDPSFEQPAKTAETASATDSQWKKAFLGLNISSQNNIG